MGIYGDLMKLNQEKKAQKPKFERGVVPPTVEKKAELKHRDTTTPRNHETMTPRYRDTTIEIVRAAVKVFGKEAATQRWTVEEKRAVNEIKFTYQQQGIRTGETEIARIGINFLIEDYRRNGESSILHKVLKALND